MFLCKIKTVGLFAVIITAFVFLFLPAENLFPIVKNRIAQNTIHEISPETEISDSINNRSRYKWFLRKQLIPVNYSWLSLGVNMGLMNNSSVLRTAEITVTSGRYINLSNFIQLSGSLGWVYIKESSDFGREIENNVKLYNISLEFKSYLPSYLPGISQYILCGFGMDCFSYRLRVPAELEYYNDFEGITTAEEIHDDYFTALRIQAGLGFAITLVNDYQLCAEISPGLFFPASSTYLGMQNSLLKKSFTFKMKLSVYFPYKEI